jgi:hypothetical protein
MNPTSDRLDPGEGGMGGQYTLFPQSIDSLPWDGEPIFAVDKTPSGLERKLSNLVHHTLGTDRWLDGTLDVPDVFVSLRHARPVEPWVKQPDRNLVALEFFREKHASNVACSPRFTFSKRQQGRARCERDD